MSSPFATLEPGLRAARDAVLRVLPDTDAVYLFGSRARGDASAQSDLDLAVLGPPLSTQQRVAAQRELSALLDCDVDLVDLATANSVLRCEAVNGGQALFKRNLQRALEFEARVLGEYADLLDATRELREGVRARGRVLA